MRALSEFARHAQRELAFSANRGRKGGRRTSRGTRGAAGALFTAAVASFSPRSRWRCEDDAHTTATTLVVDWGAGWIWVKLAAIAGMTITHQVFAKWFQAFRDDANTRPAKTYRIANEVPTLLLIVIVAMAIARPF